MPVVSDFETLLGDTTVSIGDSANSSGWTKSFGTGGRRSSSTAYIAFMVKGMTQTDEHAEVFVNDQKIGLLFNNKGGNREHWQTQIVSLGGATLNDGSNVIRVETVLAAPPASGKDDFSIRNVICHFHQEA